jgi:hypothetical protein
MPHATKPVDPFQAMPRPTACARFVAVNDDTVSMKWPLVARFDRSLRRRKTSAIEGEAAVDVACTK